MATPKNRTLLRTILVLALLGAAGFGYFYLQRPVARVQAIRGGIATNAVPGSLVVRAERDEDLKTEVGGRILKSTMVEGNFVKKGEFLAQLDTADLALEIERIETDFEAMKRRVEVDKSVETEFENAKGDFQNATRSHKQGLLSDYEYEKMQRGLKLIEQKVEITHVASKQALANMDNALRTKKRQLEKMTVLAPYDSVISKVYSRESTLVSGGTSLATLISVSRIVEAKISEENFSGIKIGQRAIVRFLGYEGTFDAKVSKILPTADPETQRYIVFLDVEIDPARLIPGITGETNIILAEREAKTLVPRRALVGRDVMVVANGRVTVRTVELGYVSLNIAEITSGLVPGEQVIVDEVDQFHDGQSVRVKIEE